MTRSSGSGWRNSRSGRGASGLQACGGTVASGAAGRADSSGTWLCTGAVFQTVGRGYGGEMIVLIGVDAKGNLLGARVIRHKETPGLGDKIELAKSKWIRDFEGKSLESPPAEKWAVKKDGGVFDQFAGATITPRAVVKAVKEGMSFYAAHRDEILEGK